jgi:hypothetical protein
LASVVKIIVVERLNNKIFEPPRTQRAQRKAKFPDYANLALPLN